MKRKQLLKALTVMIIVIFDRCLELSGEKRAGSIAELVIHAICGRLTTDGREMFVLAMEQIVFLMLFLILCGDRIASRQRTGATYIFVRMNRRTAWFVRECFWLFLYAVLYCGIFIGTHTVISFAAAKSVDTAGLFAALLRLLTVLTLICGGFAIGCNWLCGLFGSAAGITGTILLVIIMTVLSVQRGLLPFVSCCNPLAFQEGTFTSQVEFGRKGVILLCEADIIVVGKATGALDVTYGTTGQEFEIQETIRGSLEAGNKAWIYMPYMLQVMDGEIVYREAVNLMQPQETYLLFLKEDILSPYRDELHFAPINGITPYLRTGFGSLASLPSEARKDIYDNWKEYDCFTASRKLAEAWTAIARGILDRI